MVPVLGKAGSFILKIQVVLNELVSEQEIDAAWNAITEEGSSHQPSTSGDSQSVEGWTELLEVLRAQNVQIESILSVNGSTRKPLKLKKEDLGPLIRKFKEMRQSSVLASSQIPQADELQRVLNVVEMLAKDGVVDLEKFELSDRQLRYYKKAAEILGLIRYERLTRIGWVVSRLPEDQQLELASMLFETCPVGAKWLQWSGAKSLLDLQEDDAERFLLENTIGLSKDTCNRRARTLRSWLGELKKHHYLAGH